MIYNAHSKIKQTKHCLIFLGISLSLASPRQKSIPSIQPKRINKYFWTLKVNFNAISKIFSPINQAISFSIELLEIYLSNFPFAQFIWPNSQIATGNGIILFCSLSLPGKPIQSLSSAFTPESDLWPFCPAFVLQLFWGQKKECNFYFPKFYPINISTIKNHLNIFYSRYKIIFLGFHNWYRKK